MSKKVTKTEELQLRIDELIEALQRERADAMNIRRRAEEEKASLSSTHKVAIVRELLPVIDNFELSLKYAPDELKGNDYIKGVSSIVKQFEDVLDKIGVIRIKTVGEEFDPSLHEAVSHKEDEGKEVISEEVQSGYMIGGQVIRCAMVKVN